MASEESHGYEKALAFFVLSLATDVVFELASLGTYHVTPVQGKSSPDQVSDSLLGTTTGDVAVVHKESRCAALSSLFARHE